MKKWGKKLNLETKTDLILLVLGLGLIIGIVTFNEEVRKDYISTEYIEDIGEKVEKVNTNMMKIEEEDSTEKRVMTIISQELYINQENLKILSINTFEKFNIATFTYELGNESYEGICQISREDEVLFKGVDKINKNEPFTLHEVAFTGEETSNFIVIYGVINTSIIKSININFYDNTIVNMVLEDKDNYVYIYEAHEVPIVRVEGLDENLNIFYQWDKIYFNPV